MTDAYVIETRDRAAGVAVRDIRGFRFFAAEAPFFALDKRVFPHLRAVKRAVERLAAHRAQRSLRAMPEA